MSLEGKLYSGQGADPFTQSVNNPSHPLHVSCVLVKVLFTVPIIMYLCWFAYCLVLIVHYRQIAIDIHIDRIDSRYNKTELYSSGFNTLY